MTKHLQKKKPSAPAAKAVVPQAAKPAAAAPRVEEVKPAAPAPAPIPAAAPVAAEPPIDLPQGWQWDNSSYRFKKTNQE